MSQASDLTSLINEIYPTSSQNIDLELVSELAEEFDLDRDELISEVEKGETSGMGFLFSFLGAGPLGVTFYSAYKHIRAKVEKAKKGCNSGNKLKDDKCMADAKVLELEAALDLVKKAEKKCSSPECKKAAGNKIKMIKGKIKELSY